MPHAPILIPSVASERAGRVQSTIGAMRETARRAIAAKPDTVVLISPHSPRQQEAFGIWKGERLFGTLRHFGAPDEAVDFPTDASLSDQIAHHAGQRGLRTGAIPGTELDQGSRRAALVRRGGGLERTGRGAGIECDRRFTGG